MGLVGFGNVGRLLARKLAGFRPTILVSDPFAPVDDVHNADAEGVDLAELLARADVISLHARLTDETRCLIGAAELVQMRPGSWLVNTARAELVDETALMSALESGRLGGAALDVHWSEPLAPDSPLLNRHDVLLFPHVAGSTTTSQADSVRLLAERLATWVSRHWTTTTDGRI